MSGHKPPQPSNAAKEGAHLTPFYCPHCKTQLRAYVIPFGALPGPSADLPGGSGIYVDVMGCPNCMDTFRKRSQSGLIVLPGGKVDG